METVGIRGYAVEGDSFVYENVRYTPCCILLSSRMSVLMKHNVLKVVRPHRWNYLEFVRESTEYATVYINESGEYCTPCGAGIIKYDAVARDLLDKAELTNNAVKPLALAMGI